MINPTQDEVLALLQLHIQALLGLANHPSPPAQSELTPHIQRLTELVPLLAVVSD